MTDDVRQSSGSSNMTSTTVTTTTGTGTSESAKLDECTCFTPGPEKIEVEQVLGAEMAQRVVEFDMVVPNGKPDIEQVIDVYVKDVEIKSIDVITDKVIIRGDLEVKVMYVADLPNQPVHAFEKKHVKFTRDIVINGAEPDMKATADVTVEYVDYDPICDDPRKVHITIVLKFWARVVDTTELDVYALGPIDQVGEIENTTADTVVSASEFGADDKVSASQFDGQMAGYGSENILVVGPMTPTAGTTMGVSGTAVVTGSVVNVRTGPGTNFPVVVKVKKGDKVTLKEQAFGWYQVLLADGTKGWVASWLLEGASKG